MPDHTVITTFTLVKFLLSFAASTKVSVSVYTRKMFTLVSKLSYLSKPFKSCVPSRWVVPEIAYTAYIAYIA